MSPIVHGTVAWLFALFILSKAWDRRLAVVAGVAPDLDGVFILFDRADFVQYHHTFGHSFVFGILVALAAVGIGKQRKRMFIAAMGAFSLHILCDFLGSNWSMMLLFPLSQGEITSTGYITVRTIEDVILPLSYYLSFLAVVAVMFLREVTPLEFLSERFDRKVVGCYVFPLKYRCHLCGRRAFMQCVHCNEKVCLRHTDDLFRSRCKPCGGGTDGTDETGRKNDTDMDESTTDETHEADVI